MIASDLGYVDIVERGEIFSKLYSTNRALNIIAECRKQKITYDKLPVDLKNILREGIKNGLEVITEIDDLLEKIEKGEKLTEYESAHAHNLLEAFTFHWRGISEIVIKDKHTKTDISRIKNARSNLESMRKAFLEFKRGKGFKKISKGPLTFQKISSSIDSFQGELFKNWREDFNAIEQYSEELYVPLGITRPYQESV